MSGGAHHIDRRSATARVDYEWIAGKHRRRHCWRIPEGFHWSRGQHERATTLLGRASPDAFFLKENTTIQGADEDLFEFLARIHTEFQYIHPFRDGNGRIGRMIMNLHLMKNEHPILVLLTTISNMFNHGIEMGRRGNLSIFTRLLEEAIFNSLQIYEDALKVESEDSSLSRRNYGIEGYQPY